MLRVILAALALAVVSPPGEEIKQPPQAPPCAHEDMSCVTPTLYVEAADQLTALNINLHSYPTPYMGKGSPEAPDALVLVVCRTDDLTGTRIPPGSQPDTVVMPSRDWRDLELHIENGEVECEHVEVPIEDASVYSDKATADMVALDPNMGNQGACARIGVMFASTYSDKPGWDVLAVGCPTPITDATGKIVGWKMPECPRQIAALKGIKCRFTKREV